MSEPYPLGKLPADVLAALLSRHPTGGTRGDLRVVLGPRPGEDAAVIDLGDRYLLTKTDPITFATDEIGWYAVNVNANDIATMGGTPEWFMATLLFPGGQTDRVLVESIFEQVYRACDALGVTLIGGHSEITYGLDRPIVVGVMLGLAEKDRLVMTGGAQPGDVLIVTKGVPVEATAIIARERAPILKRHFSSEFVARCAEYLRTPGISVVLDAQIVMRAGRVHAMHDPTEGGLATGLWEMAEASAKRLVVDASAAVIPESQALCDAVELDPLGAIASGALLLAAPAQDADAIIAALNAEGIAAFPIGRVEEGPAAVIDAANSALPLPRPPRDEIAHLFE